MPKLDGFLVLAPARGLKFLDIGIRVSVAIVELAPRAEAAPIEKTEIATFPDRAASFIILRDWTPKNLAGRDAIWLRSPGTTAIQVAARVEPPRLAGTPCQHARLHGREIGTGSHNARPR